LANNEPKLSYNANLLRVKVQFTRAVAKANPEPQADLFSRAKSKMESVKKKGEIESYVVYETRFRKAWEALAEDDDLSNETTISITLAAGAPELPGVTIVPSANEKAIADLTINTPPGKLKEWRFECFKQAVYKKLRESGIKQYANNAQIHGAFIKARGGEHIQALPLSAAPSGGKNSDKLYSVIANKARHEIGVVIRDIKEMRDKDARDAMLKLITQAVRQMQAAAPTKQYKLLKKDFMLALHTAMEGPELVEIDLPIVLLAAIGRAKRIRRAAGIPAKYPGMGKLEFAISDEKMEVNVLNFSLEMYDDPSFEVTLQWVKYELGRNGITSEMTPDLEKACADAITSNESLEGMLVAEGNVGQGGTGPYLHEVFKDADARSDIDLEDGDVDLRDLQQRKTVKANQLVAEVRFNEPSKPAYNIYGEEIERPADDELIIKVGDGIQQNEAGKFYATCDGIPVLDKDSISLSKVMIHQGDVNLRTGNIDFDGPVEIKGSIDNGAKVETSGDLIVHGTIRGGFVRCGGTLTAKAGIVTADQGRVQARGDVHAAFIENSKVACGGDLLVRKALINSTIIAGGSIRTVSKDGVIAGGQISSRESLYTTNLGFKNGAVTRLNIGVDWRVEIAVGIRTSRLDDLQKSQTENRHELRELVQKTKAQLTKKHKEMKEELQDRLTRIRLLVEKAQAHLEKAEKLLSYNSDSKIFVKDQLSSNVDIHIGGQKIAISNDVAGVAILSKRRRGSYIQPIEDIEAEEEDKASSSKKAS
jgi:uncharacterized protein